jgi:hypothetical protein
MKGICNTEVNFIDEDFIKVLGKNYYSEEYLKEMMQREFHRGNRIIKHVAEIQYINKPENENKNTL